MPGWPRLRPDMAAAYLGLGRSTLESLDIPRVKAKSLMLYDRHTLDGYADRLSGRSVSEQDILEALG